jgi:signal transduction histidine kinase
MLTLLSTAGISAGAITTLSIERTLIMAYLGLLLLPPTAAAAFLQDSQGIAVTLMFLTYAVFMFSVAGRLNREYWDALHNNELLKQRARDLEASNQELESYSYSIAHDLRTPLRSIISFSQILLENPRDTLSQEEIADLGRIVRAGKHMAGLIDDILELARIARKDLSFRETDISDLAESYLRQLAEAEPQRRVRYRVQRGLCMTGDPKLLEVALRNLLDNAWKFTRNREQGEIVVSASRDGAETVFCVRDNGIGFDMRYADRLFKPFERLHDEREFPGTGVGLAIVQRILLRHGGRIWAESEAGKGACFCFVTAAV